MYTHMTFHVHKQKKHTKLFTPFCSYECDTNGIRDSCSEWVIDKVDGITNSGHGTKWMTSTLSQTLL